MSPFPGGGRILFRDDQGLKWAYADGRIVDVAGGFSGGQLSPLGDLILAWRPTEVPGAASDEVDYYQMKVGGSDIVPVLSAESPANVRHELVALSPDEAVTAHGLGPMLPGESVYAGDATSETFSQLET
jgi:hypothetical protein